MARRADQRGLVGTGVIALLIIIVVVGIVAVEGGSILFTRLQVQDIAEAAAFEAATTFRRTHSAETARESALSVIEDRDEEVKLTRFELAADGTVTLTVRKRASTFLVQRIGFLSDLAVARATETVEPPT
jgi:Flp pilus assembly protein TadG